MIQRSLLSLQQRMQLNFLDPKHRTTTFLRNVSKCTVIYTVPSEKPCTFNIAVKTLISCTI